MSVLRRASAIRAARQLKRIKLPGRQTTRCPAPHRAALCSALWCAARTAASSNNARHDLLAMLEWFSGLHFAYYCSKL
eukprot:1152872-Pelagomonas_calceolata.AAC.4